jgi:uncharacterized protein
MQTVTSKGTLAPRRDPADWIAGALVVIGAINWGLLGAVNIDLVASIFGPGTPGARIVYVLVGLAGIYVLVRAFMPPRERRIADR